MTSLVWHASEACHTNDVINILPHEKDHGITLRRLKQVFIPITQILQWRALKQKVLLISEDTLLARRRRRIITSFPANSGLIRCLAPHGKSG